MQALRGSENVCKADGRRALWLAGGMLTPCNLALTIQTPASSCKFAGIIQNAAQCCYYSVAIEFLTHFYGHVYYDVRTKSRKITILCMAIQGHCTRGGNVNMLEEGIERIFR